MQKNRFDEDDMIEINLIADDIMDKEANEDGLSHTQALVYATLEYLMGMYDDESWNDFVLEAAHEVAFNLLPEETKQEIAQRFDMINNVNTSVAH